METPNPQIGPSELIPVNPRTSKNGKKRGFSLFGNGTKRTQAIPTTHEPELSHLESGDQEVLLPEKPSPRQSFQLAAVTLPILKLMAKILKAVRQINQQVWGSLGDFIPSVTTRAQRSAFQPFPVYDGIRCYRRAIDSGCNWAVRVF
jgi:hypothetical protein